MTNHHTGTRQDHGAADLQGRYWPTTTEPPRLPDGKVDVRALLARWDDETNNEARP